MSNGYTYWLPGDDAEAERLNVQHYSIQHAFFHGRELLFAPVDFNKPTKVLDAGCGTGIWSMEFAMQYPAANFILLDFNTQPCEVSYPTLPSNVSLSSFDLEKDFASHPEWQSSFDLINQRLMIAAFSRAQWLTVLCSYHSVLKPGGYVQLIEYDQDTFFGGPCIDQVQEWLRELTASGDKVFSIVRELPGLLTEAGFSNVETHEGKATFEEELPKTKNGHDPVLFWVLNSVTAVISKACEVGLTDQKEFGRVREGVRTEFEEARRGERKIGYTATAIVAQRLA